MTQSFIDPMVCDHACMDAFEDEPGWYYCPSCDLLYEQEQYDDEEV